MKTSATNTICSKSAPFQFVKMQVLDPIGERESIEEWNLSLKIPSSSQTRGRQKRDRNVKDMNLCLSDSPLCVCASMTANILDSG